LSLDRLKGAQGERKDESISPDMPRLSKIDVPSPCLKEKGFALPEDDGLDRQRKLELENKKMKK